MTSRSNRFYEDRRNGWHGEKTTEVEEREKPNEKQPTSNPSYRSSNHLLFLLHDDLSFLHSTFLTLTGFGDCLMHAHTRTFIYTYMHKNIHTCTSEPKYRTYHTHTTLQPPYQGALSICACAWPFFPHTRIYNI